MSEFESHLSTQPHSIVKLKPWEGIEGRLHKVVQEGETFIVAYIGECAILLPNEPILTKGGHIDLRAWVGQDVDLQREDERYAVGLLKLDPLQMRAWDLEEALAGLISRFTGQGKGKQLAGDDAALAAALRVLGLPKGFTVKDLWPFHKATAAREARTKAVGAVMSGRPGSRKEAA